jgi:hypothetical protein
MRKTTRKTRRPTSLEDAYQMCLDHALAKHRRAAKALAELMGVPISTFYRWLSECSMPANLIRQFEAFCGTGYVSEYLCTSGGGRVVIDIPTGRSATVTDLSEVQANSAVAVGMLAKFYEGKATAEETLEALTGTLTDLAYHRQNVIKHSEPELALFGGEQ